MDNELPFALLRWIKAQQEDERRHREKMALRNYQEDKEFARLMSFIVRYWPKLKQYERLMILRLTEQHDNIKCLSPAQRSVIVGMWLRYCA